MEFYKNTESTVRPEEVRFDDYSAWVCTNIRMEERPLFYEKIEGEDGAEESIERYQTMYVYDMYRYANKEYLQILNEENKKLKGRFIDVELAMVEMYEGK